MKKIFAMAAMLLCGMGAMAQNLQVHYDFGKKLYDSDESGRQILTATFEQFKADNTGSWYYFIDLDIDKNGVLGAYTEVSREFNFLKTGEMGGLAAHVEYDGGLSRAAGTFQQAGLVGAAWNGHNRDFSKTYSIQVLYKQFFGQDFENGAKIKPYSSFQVTGVWGLNFLQNKLTFSGFADLWLGKKSSDNSNCLVFLTEPQLWYNFNKHVSAGTEIEISNNFIFQSVSPWANDKFYVNPTLAVKYNF